MNPSYFRIKLPQKAAIERLCSWNEKKPKEEIVTAFDNVVDVSVNESGEWRGDSLYVYEKDDWTVFEDLSGGYAAIPAESWKIFAGNCDLVVAGYNDSIPYGELVVIISGMVKKEFFEDVSMPEDNVNHGDMPGGIDDWTDAAEFVDNDEFLYSENGTVLIF